MSQNSGREKEKEGLGGTEAEMGERPGMRASFCRLGKKRVREMAGACGIPGPSHHHHVSDLPSLFLSCGESRARTRALSGIRMILLSDRAESGFANSEAFPRFRRTMHTYITTRLKSGLKEQASFRRCYDRTGERT